MRVRAWLRRLRDLKAGNRPAYQKVALTGFVVTGMVVVVIRHPGLDVVQIEQGLLQPVGGRIASLDGVWPMRWLLDPADAVEVARAGRGIERLRFRVGHRKPPTKRRPREWDLEPMPILIS